MIVGAMCSYAEVLYDCDGNCIADEDEDGVCDALEVSGCKDATACNFDELATEADSSCVIAVEYYDCDSVCLADADKDGVCDALEVSGCTDDLACNFDSLATEDDG